MVAYLVFYKILQFFIVMACGFILVKKDVVKADDSKMLSKLCLYLFVPASIIGAFNVKDAGNEITIGLGLAFLSAIVIHIILLLFDFGFKKIFKANVVERTAVFYSNAGSIIIPIIGFALGNEWVIYSSAYLAVQQSFIWTHCAHLYSKEKKFNIKKILCNINIISIIIGIIIFFAKIELPTLASDLFNSLGGMSGYAAMLVCGMLAAQVDFKKILSNKRLYLTVFMRMFASPLLILIVMKILLSFIHIVNADKIILVSFLASITPTASTIVQFAQIYDEDVDFAVAANIVTTLLCIITMPLFVMIY